MGGPRLGSADALASEAPPCCESVPRLYQSTPKRREGQRTGALFSMQRQARPGHHLVANGRTGHHLNVGFSHRQAQWKRPVLLQPATAPSATYSADFQHAGKSQPSDTWLWSYRKHLGSPDGGTKRSSPLPNPQYERACPSRVVSAAAQPAADRGTKHAMRRSCSVL